MMSRKAWLCCAVVVVWICETVVVVVAVEALNCELLRLGLGATQSERRGEAEGTTGTTPNGHEQNAGASREFVGTVMVFLEFLRSHGPNGL